MEYFIIIGIIISIYIIIYSLLTCGKQEEDQLTIDYDYKEYLLFLKEYYKDRNK